jgi:hypothetical protein
LSTDNHDIRGDCIDSNCQQESILDPFSGIINYSLIWLKNKSKLTNNKKSTYRVYYQYEIREMMLQYHDDLVKTKKSNIILKVLYEESFELKDMYISILSVLLRFTNHNAKQIFNRISSSKNENEYKKILRQIEVLLKLGLIEYSDDPEDESMRVGNMYKFSHTYRLSIVGITFVLSNYHFGDFIDHDPLKQLTTNYPNNLLFVYFLYPYFSKPTFLDPDSGSLILRYLYEICKLIKSSMLYYRSFTDPECVKSNLIDDKYESHYLFTWPSKPGYNVDKNEIVQSFKDYVHKELELN